MGGRRGRKITLEDKQCAIKLIKEAQQSGCKKISACNILGISIRTVERWEKVQAPIDRRASPINAPSHQLTVEERAKIIAVANEPQYLNAKVN